MKSLITIVFAGLLSATAYTQEDSGTVTNVGIVSVTEKDGNTIVSVVPEGEIVIEENLDTTRIKIGKKGIVIIEGEKGTQVNIEKLDAPEAPDAPEEFDEFEDFDEMDEDFDSKKHEKFKPHWAGFEIGLNNYVNSDMSMSLDNTMDFMDLNTGRSWNININVMEYGFGLGTDKIGLVTGLGFEMSNYHFDNNNTIAKVGGLIQPVALSYPDMQKNRLQTTYLRAPLLLEFQIPAGKKRIYLSAGPIAGVKLGSNTKIVYKEGGDKQKVKDKDDFNLTSLRYGFTARAGYRDLRLFANYYMTPLFEANKGPELYPFSVGLTLVEF
jgi:hypothetical protein